MVRDSAVSGTSGGQISAKARYVNSLHPPGRLLHLSPALAGLERAVRGRSVRGGDVRPAVPAGTGCRAARLTARDERA